MNSKRPDVAEMFAMKSAIALIVIGMILADASASAQETDPKIPVSDGFSQTSRGVVSVDQTPDVKPGDPDERIRRIRKTVIESASPVSNSGTSNAFPYATAADPPREPHRRAVACGPYARETDGSSTCIGISEPARESEHIPIQPSTRLRRAATTSRQPAVPMAAIPTRRLTNSRNDRPPLRLEAATIGGNGFLSFLGSVFSRN